jgi:hypothetical protein
MTTADAADGDDGDDDDDEMVMSYESQQIFRRSKQWLQRRGSKER